MIAALYLLWRHEKHQMTKHHRVWIHDIIQRYHSWWVSLMWHSIMRTCRSSWKFSTHTNGQRMWPGTYRSKFMSTLTFYVIRLFRVLCEHNISHSIKWQVYYRPHTHNSNKILKWNKIDTHCERVFSLSKGYSSSALPSVLPVVLSVIPCSLSESRAVCWMYGGTVWLSWLSYCCYSQIKEVIQSLTSPLASLSLSVSSGGMSVNNELTYTVWLWRHSYTTR